MRRGRIPLLPPLGFETERASLERGSGDPEAGAARVGEVRGGEAIRFSRLAEAIFSGPNRKLRTPVGWAALLSGRENIGALMIAFSGVFRMCRRDEINPTAQVHDAPPLAAVALGSIKN